MTNASVIGAWTFVIDSSFCLRHSDLLAPAASRISWLLLTPQPMYVLTMCDSGPAWRRGLSQRAQIQMRDPGGTSGPKRRKVRVRDARRVMSHFASSPGMRSLAQV